jgi:hypothetical protein
MYCSADLSCCWYGLLLSFSWVVDYSNCIDHPLVDILCLLLLLTKSECTVYCIFYFHPYLDKNSLTYLGMWTSKCSSFKLTFCEALVLDTTVHKNYSTV